MQEKMCTLVQVRCERTHVTLLYRFLADMLHLHDCVTSGFGDAGDATSAHTASVLSPTAAVSPLPAKHSATMSTPQPSLSPSKSQLAQPMLPCLLEVTCTDLRLDVPRCSGSAEFLSLTCANATVLAPAAPAYTEDLMPSMDR